MCSTGDHCDEPLPDLARLSDGELKEAIALHEVREEQLSAGLCVLRGKLEFLRQERLARLRRPPTHVDIAGAADALLRRWLPDGAGEAAAGRC
jgi:hypothetical protein